MKTTKRISISIPEELYLESLSRVDPYESYSSFVRRLIARECQDEAAIRRLKAAADFQRDHIDNVKT